MVHRSSLQSVRSLAATVLAKNIETAKHQENSAALAYQIARRLALPGSTVMGTYLGGLLHDIGKIAIPNAVLRKPAPLTTQERINIKTHPQVGYDILRYIPFEWPLAEIVLQHHERLDGSGYPRGLANGALRMEARIIAVADLIDAFTAHRPYINDSSMQALFDLLSAQRGVTLDSDVVDAGMWVMERFPHLAFQSNHDPDPEAPANFR